MYAMFTFCCSKQNCLIQKVSKIITVICLDNPLKTTITICYKSQKRKSNDFFKRGFQIRITIILNPDFHLKRTEKQNCQNGHYTT